ncbi:triosephosphate isomerase [Balneicella halophila]|uniref:Triosephosphate isomerase n=1 Tax=Balneicella halophila TaxID=1537566 RepID=A0A7L4USA5_BALHA|nr:triose-phosphate isomerase [Balneicella halophila]PVX52549.1 triosephosphate isomerase [Balneicella halophila]
MRRNIVAGNWKMNNTLDEGLNLIKDINVNAKKTDVKGVQVIVATPFIHLAKAVEEAISPVRIAAQNCASEESGAYTGEVSAKMIRSTGTEYVIIGHSERRAYYGETDEILTKKVDQAIANKLYPIFCIGEVLDDRENDKHFEVVENQLKNALFHLSEKDFGRVILAYEPVWAIGTGKTASPEQAQEMHAFIRKVVAEKYNDKIADEVSILYGGSMKPANAKELVSQADVDGGLIGGASLNADDFFGIITAF